MPSLSFWDRGKLRSHGFSIKGDLAWMEHMLTTFMKPWKGIKSYKPDLHILEGNHDGCENCEGTRLYRYVQDKSEARGSWKPMAPFRKAGWKVHHFQHPVVLDGVYYSHLFPKSSTGNVTARSKAYGASNARLQAKANMVSCTAGHKPGFDFAVVPATGRIIHSLIAGSFYNHDEHYKGPQGNDYWRGCIMKYEVRHGAYNLSMVSMNHLRKNYG